MILQSKNGDLCEYYFIRALSLGRNNTPTAHNIQSRQIIKLCDFPGYLAFFNVGEQLQ